MIGATRRWLHLAPLALLAYVPLLLTAPGRVAADTKSYLYLDPGRLLSRAWSMWDPNVGLGTVTHQTIGYLWPMGPWFWAFDRLGVPDWVAQRLWVGSLLVAAGAGVLFLGRTLGLRHLPALTAAALVYELSPYVLHYAARISVLLLPWAALPWLVAIVQRALRRGGWRHPATFALVVLTVGGVNATALVLAGLGPLLWVPFAVLVHGEVTWRAAAAAVARIGVLTTATSLWWIAGLWVQGGWGIDILRYTETVATVARTSLSSEVLRGLGYWFFYGGDKLGPWIEPAGSYTQNLALIGVGFALPVLAISAASLARWRYRAFFVVLLVGGTAIGVGAYPYGSPSPLGALFKSFANSSSAGLALRSTPRALPLVVLAIAVLLAAAIGALAQRRPAAGVAAAGAVSLLAVANIPPLWTGDVIGENLQRPAAIPSYWKDAAAHLDSRGHATRVLEIPGSDFASYRWGSTVDPITPGLIDRPYVARELIPYGTPPSADLLIALDRRLQESIFDPAALAPIARLLGVGDVVLRSDLQYERYRLPRPPQVWDWMEPAPEGLAEPVVFGADVVNRAPARLPLHDELFLSLPANLAEPPAIAAFPVPDPMPVVRARSASAPVIVAGDGDGLVDAAAHGLLGGDSIVLYSASLDDEGRARAMDAGASLVLTDTNRKRGRRWSTMRDNSGYTEPATERPLRDDPSDARLDVFPDAPIDAFTTVEQRGVRSVGATGYGNPITFTAEDRPALAIDGDPATAWRVGAFSPVKGERWRVELEAPVTTDRIDVVQAAGNRWITEVGVIVDGDDVGTMTLGEASFSEPGEPIDLGRPHTFSTLELEVRADNIGFRGRYEGLSGVGLAEVHVGGARVREVVRLPGDLLDERAAGHPLSIVLTRSRSNPIEPTAGDEEQAMARVFRLPGARRFALAGEARLSVRQADEAIDDLLGLDGATARSSRRLAAALATRASSVIDGDPSTSWTTGLFGPQAGEWVEVDLPAPRTIRTLGLSVVADPYHSLVSEVTVSTDEGDSVTVPVPPVQIGDERGHVESVQLALGRALRGSTYRITVEAVHERITTEWYGLLPVPMPVALAEVGLPASHERTDGWMPARCRNDLLTLDGRGVWLRVSGRATVAERREPLGVSLCGPDRGGLAIGAGDHELVAAPGAATGFDLDGLLLTSGADGRPAAPPPRGAAPTPSSRAEVRVVDEGRAAVTVDVTSDEPVWLVLGQSHSRGWQASGLGRPQLVDGFANGWLVPPTGGEPRRVTMRFTPQRTVNAALVGSLLASLLCAGIVVASRRRPAPPAAGGAPRWGGLAERLPRRPPWPLVVLTGLGVGAGGTLLVHPATGAAVGAAAAAALLAGRGHAVLAAGAVLSVGSAGAFTVAKQWRNGFPPDFGWPGFFSAAHHLAWVGLLLLAASLAVARVRRRHGRA